MIAWSQVLGLAARLAADPHAADRAVAEATATAPPFQNRDYPLSPLPVLLDATAVGAVVPLLEAYVRALGRLVAAYRDHGEVRDWFGLAPAAEALVRADRRLGDAPLVCRLDGYLEQGSERLRVLENNADAPAGTLFTPRVNDLAARSLERAGVAAPGAAAPDYADEGRLLDVLRACARRAGASDAGVVTVLQCTDPPSTEVREMVASFRAAGCDATVADPRAVEVRRGRAVVGGRPAGLVWNKVNTVDWLRLSREDPDLDRRWLRALDDADLVHVNPFGARFVAESKLALALLRCDRFAGLFEPGERAAVEALLPPAARLDATAGPEREAALATPARYVVKDAYDIRGDGVRIGWAADPGTWREAVTPPAGSARLLQRRVRPTAYPVLRATDPRVVCMPASLDTYVIEGVVAGFGAKAGTGEKVNVFQGGQKLAVRVVGIR